MPKRNPLVLAVDSFMAAPKRLLGVGGSDDWKRETATSGLGLEYRIKWAIELGGVSTSGMSLVLVGHPNDTPQTWHFNLVYGDKRVAGLDIEHEDRPHSNSLRRPNSDVPYALKGSHWHSWEDNKHLATRAALPQHLSIARPLPPSLALNSSARFVRSLYWFCEQTNIAPPAAHVDIPGRSLLL